MKLRGMLHGGAEGQPDMRRAVLLGLFLAGGVIAGQLAARQVSQEDLFQVARYLHSYGALAASDAGVPFLGTLWAWFRYPLAVFVLAASAAGCLFIPPILTVQGFAVSFAAAVFAGSMGPRGVLLALVAFGLRSFMLFPCTLFLGSAAFERKRGQSVNGLLLRRAAVCVFFLLLGAVLEQSIILYIFRRILAAFP